MKFTAHTKLVVFLNSCLAKYTKQLIALKNYVYLTNLVMPSSNLLILKKIL